MKWAGVAQPDYYSYIRANWNGGMYAMQSGISSFEAFWTKSLRDGVFDSGTAAAGAVAFTGDINAAANALSKPAAD